MPKKKTLDEIQRLSTEIGYELIGEFSTARTSTKFKCLNFGHIRLASFDKLKLRPDCPECNGRMNRGNKQSKIDFIRKEFAAVSYTLLSDKYEGARAKLKFRCDRGHERTTTWHRFKGGHRCADCSRDNLGIRHSIEYIREEFAKKQWILVSTEYKNNKQKLKFICNNGHHHSMNWNSFVSGRGCYKCCKTLVTIDLIREEFEKIEWTLLTSHYENVEQKLDFICSNGHTHKISWHHFSAGWRCMYCSGNDRICFRPEEEQQSIKIAETLRTNLKNCMKKQRLKQIAVDSKTSLCNSLAVSILKTIGDRPNDDYHLDHIIPSSWFFHLDKEQIDLCWDVKNFQWLTEKENSKKNNRLTQEMFLSLTRHQINVANLATKRPKDQEKLMKSLGLFKTPEEAKRDLEVMSSYQDTSVI